MVQKQNPQNGGRPRCHWFASMALPDPQGDFPGPSPHVCLARSIFFHPTKITPTLIHLILFPTYFIINFTYLNSAIIVVYFLIKKIKIN